MRVIGGIGVGELLIILIPVIVIFVAGLVVCILYFTKRPDQNAPGGTGQPSGNQGVVNQPMGNQSGSDQPVGNGTKYCSQCRNQVSDASAFCPKCGGQL